MEDTPFVDSNASSLWRQTKAVALVPPQPGAAAATGAGSLGPAAAAEVVPTTCSAAEQAGEYHKLLDVVGTPNYETMQRLFAGDGAPPASTVPAIQVSFELFEAVQNRFAATKQVLERTKADLLTRNQHYSLLHQDMLRLKDEYAVLQKRISEAEDRNTQLHQQRAKLEVTVEQLGREVAQGHTALDALRGKLLLREDELQLSQSRVAESLVALSQKEAVIGTLRRELGRCGQLRYGSANGAKDGARDGEDDGQLDGGGGEGGNAQAYTAHMLDRIAADVEGRSQEARMKLNMAELEGRLSRLGEEKDSVLAQHTQYRQHVQLALQTYEAEAMLREDTLARHTCVHTPYFAGAQEAVYAKLVNLQTGEALAAGQGSRDGKSATTTGGEAPPPPLQSFGGLAFEVRQLMDRLSKMHIDDASRLQHDLSLCVEAHHMSLQAVAEVVGFLSVMEEEVVQRRLTLPEVREEWRKARVPGFAQAIAQSLRESGSQFGRGMVGILQQENIFVAEADQARVLQEQQQQQQQQRVPAAGRNTSAASVAGGKGQQPHRRSRSDGTPGPDRSRVISASGPGGRGSCSAAELAAETEPRKVPLTGAGSVEVLSALLPSGDGQNSDNAERVQFAAFATATEPLATTGSPTPLPTRSGGVSVTSEEQASSATGASDMKVAPKGHLQTTTGRKDAAETFLAAASLAEAEAASALRSSKDALASLATPLSTTRLGNRASAAAPASTASLDDVPDTTLPKDQLARKSSLAAVAKQQVVGGITALHVMPNVVMCPHCAHEVTLNAATGESLPALADDCSGGGTRHSLESPNAAAAAWHKTRDKASSASSRQAGSASMSPAKSSESASAGEGGRAAAAADTHRYVVCHTKSSAASTKSKGKKKLGSANGSTGSSGKRPKRESFTGSRSVSSSPVQSRTTSPTSSPPHRTRALGTHSRVEGTRPPFASGEQQISSDGFSFLICADTSQIPPASRRSKNNVSAATPADAGAAAAGLASALSDCQDRLTRTSQELQEVRAANAALQAQLLAALAAAAESATATRSSTPAGARGHQATLRSSASVDEGLSVFGKGAKKSWVSKVVSSSSRSLPSAYDNAEGSAAKAAVRASSGLLEADQVSTSVNRESSHGDRYASRTPPPRQQSPHADIRKAQLSSGDGHISASAAGGEGGRTENERGNAVTNSHPFRLSLATSSSASPSLPADRRETVLPGVHKGEQTSSNDDLSALAVASTGEYQLPAQMQLSSSAAAKAKPMPGGVAEAMGNSAQKSRGGQEAGVATSTHNNSYVTLRSKLLSPPVSCTLQRDYSKRVGGGLAAAYATQSQRDSRLPLMPIWGSAYPPVLNRRHNALACSAASSTGTAGAPTVHRAIISPASIPGKTQGLGLVITNSRVTDAPAKQLERASPSRYVSNTTKVKAGGHPNRFGGHTIELAPTSVPLLRPTSGLSKMFLPSLPPLSPSHMPSSVSGCPLDSGTIFSSPVPLSARPTIPIPEATHPDCHAATAPATTAAAAAAGMSVAGSNIVSSNSPTISWFSSMPQQSVRAGPPSSLSAGATALNKRQQRKIEIQQLRLCLGEDASRLYNGCCDAQSSAAAGALKNARVARQRIGGLWYSTRCHSTGGRLHQVMVRRMRDTWARGHLYEEPICTTPASVPTSGANADFDAILGGRSLASRLGEPCSASEHPPVSTRQDAPAQSPPHITGDLTPGVLTYLATPTETRRRWSLNGHSLNTYCPFSFSAANTMNSMTRRPWQRVPRTWQQQQQWNIRHASDAATSSRFVCAPFAAATPPALWWSGSRQAQLPLAANVVIFSPPVSAVGKPMDTNVVPSLFSPPCRQHRHGHPTPQLAKRDPMQQAVKRTVYTVSAPASPPARPSEVLCSTTEQEVRTLLLPSCQEESSHQQPTTSSTREADADLGKKTGDAGEA